MLQPLDIPPEAPKSLEDLLGQALDGSQLAAARRVFFSKSWDLLAGNAEMLWGEYRFRHQALFKPMVQIADAQFSCTCRAPQPCKHALALLLFARQSSERMQVNTEPPLWVAERLKDAPSSPKGIRTDTASRHLARDARWDKRLLLMQNGLDELDQWLQDTVRQGLAQAGGMQPSALERMAARLVDSKLSGPAKRLRQLAGALQTENWTETASETLATIYLFVRALRQKENLPEEQLRDVLTFAGVNLKKEEVLQEPGVKDHWLVVGMQTGEEDRLRFRRVWLFGEKTKRPALLLDYVWGNQEFPDRWLSGAAIQGEIVYYPSAYPIRAILRQGQASQQAFDGPFAYPDLTSFMKAQAQALQKHPLLTHFPAMLERVRPVHVKGKLFFMLDQAGHEIPLADDGAVNWKLLALSGGHPLTVFGEWDGHSFYPLSAIIEQRLIALH